MRKEDMAQTLYCNGTILTMEDYNPYVEAVLTDKGRILGTGSLKELKERAGGDVVMADLQGNTMLPGFIDSHGHFTACAGQFLEADVTGTESFDQIVSRVRAYISEKAIPEGRWITASGYDHNSLKERRHPDSPVLDRAAPRNPLILKHQSGHMGVFNTMALNLLGIGADTQPPQGGMIEFRDGIPTGYMEESAFIQYQSHVPMPSSEDYLMAYSKAQELYASCGITTLQEGMMTSRLLPLYQMLLQSGILKLDLAAYADISDSREILEGMRGHIKTYKNRIKIGGYKMFLDGSPQGRTAWLRTPYEPEEGGKGTPDYRGSGIMDDREVLQAILKAEGEGMQLLAHCNGDAACEQYIRQWEHGCSLHGLPRGDIRPVMVHAQLVGRDQLKRMVSLGMIPSFFLAHVYHWGDVHIRNLGLSRASHISPAASALKENLMFTLHQDSPVIKPDMLETLWCAVNRRTKAGIVLGEDERIPIWEALKAVTINGAYQYFEEHEKGSVTPGKTADFVILDRNPMTAEAEDLKEIQVKAAIKEGRDVFINALCRPAP